MSHLTFTPEETNELYVDYRADRAALCHYCGVRVESYDRGTVGNADSREFICPECNRHGLQKVPNALPLGGGE